jgi:hypothetical protein
MYPWMMKMRTKDVDATDATGAGIAVGIAAETAAVVAPLVSVVVAAEAALLAAAVAVALFVATRVAVVVATVVARAGAPAAAVLAVAATVLADAATPTATRSMMMTISTREGSRTMKVQTRTMKRNKPSRDARRREETLWTAMMISWWNERQEKPNWVLSRRPRT